MDLVVCQACYYRCPKGCYVLHEGHCHENECTGHRGFVSMHCDVATKAHIPSASELQSLGRFETTKMRRGVTPEHGGYRESPRQGMRSFSEIMKPVRAVPPEYGGDLESWHASAQGRKAITVKGEDYERTGRRNGAGNQPGSKVEKWLGLKY